MKAWVLEALAGLEKLKLAEIPDPIAARGEVVLEVRYAGLNPADRYLAQGEYPARPKMPHVLGRDGIGDVVAVGENVSDWRIGDRVIILRSEIGVTRPGTFAQRVAVAVDSLAPLPPGWTEPQAAGAALVYLTAYQSLGQWGELPMGVVLITGASGGVGVASIQLAVAMGHKVIALSRGTAKRDALLKLGAVAVVDPMNSKWREEVKELLGGGRVDLAIDTIGGELFNEVIDTLGNNGKISAVGRLAGPVPQFNTARLIFRRIRIGGVHVGAYSPPEAQEAWRKLLLMLNRAGAKPIVDRVFRFEQLREAFDRLAEGPVGKVILAVNAQA